MSGDRCWQHSSTLVIPNVAVSTLVSVTPQCGIAAWLKTALDQTRSIGDVSPMSGLPETGHGGPYTLPFCTRGKRPCGSAAHLTTPMDKARRRRTIGGQGENAREASMLCAIRSALLIATTAIVCGLAAPAGAQQAITLHGAVQFNDDHAFNKALLKFEERVKAHYGKPVDFVLHRNSELGLEKDYFAYMNQGISVDYGIVSPAHMSTFSKAAPFIDAPFLFRDLDHWNKVLDQDVLKPIADEIGQKADVMLIGYAGGGIRNIFVNKPVRNMAELKGLKVRVQGAPIWSKTFTAAGMAPTVIAYNEVYNAIQNGVIAAGENEAAGVEAMKFYEVAPNLSMTQHAITIRPLCFSGKTFKGLDKNMQAAVLRAGKEAGAYGRQVESSEDEAKLVALEKAGKLKRVAFSDRAQMKKLADPVLTEYAKEIG